MIPVWSVQDSDMVPFGQAARTSNIIPLTMKHLSGECGLRIKDYLNFVIPLPPPRPLLSPPLQLELVRPPSHTCTEGVPAMTPTGGTARLPLVLNRGLSIRHPPAPLLWSVKVNNDLGQLKHNPCVQSPQRTPLLSDAKREKTKKEPFC